MISIRNVHRAYGEVHAVVDTSFDVEGGEVVGLLGPNGAGKTTLLRMLATLIRPDSGQIVVDGWDVVKDPLKVRAKLGYETGDTGLYNRLKPVEFLRYFGQLHRIEATHLESQIEKLVESFDISDFKDRLCGNLSTGQKQRVSLARALLNDPPVLVLDEPTAGLDIVSSGFIIEALREAASNGRAVLFSTHILSEVELVADRIVILHQGRILANATLAELLEQTNTERLSHAFLQLIGEDSPEDNRGEEAD